jgi:hypothetical protein
MRRFRCTRMTITLRIFIWLRRMMPRWCLWISSRSSQEMSLRRHTKWARLGLWNISTSCRPNGMNSMDRSEMVGTGVPLPRIESVSALEGRRLRVVWKSGESHDVDVSPALLSHRSFVALRSSDELFSTAARDEFGDAVVWADGSELSATWLYELAEPDGLSNDEFRSAMESLHMSLDGMAVRLGIARRLVADYRKNRPIPRTVALATRHLMERQRSAR